MLYRIIRYKTKLCVGVGMVLYSISWQSQYFNPSSSTILLQIIITIIVVDSFLPSFFSPTVPFAQKNRLTSSSGGSASQVGIGLEPLASPLDANTLNVKSLHLIFSGNHREYIQFHVISSPHAPWSLPWLHNCHIHWSWSWIFCHSSCLQSARSPREVPSNPRTT